MAPDLRPGSELAGFRIESLVARGGMGVVYRATQLSLQREVALKLIAPELAAEESFRERFLREARMAASLEHPHVLPVYEVGETEGELYLALRYVEGADLRSLLREGPLAPERAVRLVAQLCSALEAAHAPGLLHRDVKPENVLVLGEEGAEHAYLTDFGLARPQGERGLTKTGELLGSIDYLAPELIEGGEADPRCDLYALGCLLYACLTGQPPFARAQEAATLWAHVREPVPLVSAARPELGERFDGVVERALAKDPGARYQSAAELADALAAEAPSSRRAAERATNLPRALTSFIGREREVAEILGKLEGGARLLTLTGAGGSGKTRLAIEAASTLVLTYERVYWVGLSPLRDPALVTETIAQTLGAKDGLAEHIGERELLLLLDNLEQVIEAAPELVALISKCPNLTLLVTSRELLRVQGEHEYPVPPLAEPEAVNLFCERAQLEASEEIAELCARLDNLPLAVELAAARTKALSVSQILERLSQRLDLLKGGRDADPRQQTLRATIEWSYDLLAPEEQRLFARLSVFAGSCALEAAEEVCAADLDILQSLVEKSLLRFTNERYWMLEMIREYAVEQLESSGETDELGERHGEHYLCMALEAEVHLEAGNLQEAWLDRLELDRDNLHTAIAFLSSGGTPEAELHLVTATWRFWWIRGYVSYIRKALADALDHFREPTPIRAKALEAAAYLAYLQGDLELADEHASNLLALAVRLDDDVSRAKALHLRSSQALSRGELEVARALDEEAAALLGDHPYARYPRHGLGYMALLQDDTPAARAHLADSYRLIEQIGDRDLRAANLSLLGFAALAEGNLTEAASLLKGAIEQSRRLGDQASMWSRDVIGVAGVLVALNRNDEAVRLLGVAERMREDRAIGVGVIAERLQGQVVSDLRLRLGDQAFDRGWDEGRRSGVEADLPGVLSSLD
jgi:predicted ATPase